MAVSLKIQFDTAGGALVRTVEVHTDWSRTVAGMPNSRFAVSASCDRTLNVKDLKTGKVVAGFTGDGPLLTCAICSDGATIIVDDQLGRVHYLQLK